MKQINMCPRCGGELKFINGKYQCTYCDAIFEEEKVIDIREEINSILDDLKQEKLANLRTRLWEAIHERYLSSEKITRISEEIRNYLPDDFLACFFEVVNNKSTNEVNDYLNNIDVNKNLYNMDIVIEFMIKIMEEGNLLAVNNLVERSYKDRDLTLFEKYTTMVAKKAAEIDTGVYDLQRTRDVFVAYASPDMKYVDELDKVFKANGISTFIALRNLRHGRGAVENYDKALEEAMDNCRIFLLVSSPNSRSRACDAFTKEMPYVKKRDIEMAPPEYRFDYVKMPFKYKMPRIHYIVGEKPTGTVADEVVAEFFSGIEWCYSAESAARIAFKILDEGLVVEESEAERKIRELEEKQRKQQEELEEKQRKQQEELKQMMAELMSKQTKEEPKVSSDTDLRKELEDLKKQLASNTSAKTIEKKEEPSLDSYDVVLTDSGDSKVATIKAIQGISNLGLLEAKRLCEATPAVIRSNISFLEADVIRSELEDVGAVVEIKKH